MAGRIDFDVTFTNSVTERVSITERVFPGESLHYAGPGAPPALSPERAASSWAAHQLALRSIDGDHTSGIASIRRVDVRREWSFMEARSMTAWRDLVARAESAGVVIRDEWDDGSGFSPWYVATPGNEERALYAACCSALLPKDSPVEDAELIEMEERALPVLDGGDPEARAVARDSMRLGGEVLRLRNEVFLAQSKLAEVTAERDAALAVAVQPPGEGTGIASIRRVDPASVCRVVLDNGSVRELTLAERDQPGRQRWWQSMCGAYTSRDCRSPEEAFQAGVDMLIADGAHVREVVMPGEHTRAELTAERDAFRVQRDEARAISDQIARERDGALADASGWEDIARERKTSLDEWRDNCARLQVQLDAAIARASAATSTQVSAREDAAADMRERILNELRYITADDERAVRALPLIAPRDGQ